MAQAPVARADQADDGWRTKTEHQRLSELTDKMIAAVRRNLAQLGGGVQAQAFDQEDFEGREFLLVPMGPVDEKPATPNPAKEFFDNLEELKIAYSTVDRAIHLTIRMKGWTSVHLKDLKEARANELISIGIPRQVHYIIRLDGKNTETIRISAKEPSLDYAIRLHPHSRVGNIWFRQAAFNLETMKGRVKVGIAGNAITLIGDFKLVMDPKGGEPPLKLDPKIIESLGANAELIALPLLALLLF